MIIVLYYKCPKGKGVRLDRRTKQKKSKMSRVQDRKTKKGIDTMTNYKETYNEIKATLNAIDNHEFDAFLDNRVAQIEKKNAKANAYRKEKRIAENATIAEIITSFFSTVDAPARAKDVAEGIKGKSPVSVQKVTAVMKSMDNVKRSVDDKGVAYYEMI